MEIKKKLRQLELLKAGNLTREQMERMEDERMEELVMKVQAMCPDETEMWAAYKRSRALEKSNSPEDIEKYLEQTKIVIRALRRLKAEAKPSK